MFNNNQQSHGSFSIFNLLYGLFAFALGYRAGRNLNPRNRLVLGIAFLMLSYNMYYILKSQSIRCQLPRSWEVMSEMLITGPLGYSLGELFAAVSDLFGRRRHHRQQNEQNNTEENTPERQKPN